MTTQMTTPCQQVTDLSTRLLLNLVIVLDVTWSMRPYIQGVVRALVHFLEILASGRIDGRVGLVLFRDLKEGEPMHIWRIGTEPLELKAILESTPARGGGSEPESALPALDAALNLEADSAGSCRVVLLITDAPCHDPEDQYTSDFIRRRLQENQVLFLACAPPVTSYVEFANATGGSLFGIAPNMDPDTFAKLLLDVANVTVTRTLARAQSSNAQQIALAELNRTQILGGGE